MDLSLLGENLRIARVRLGYSQQRAAEICGISEKTLGNIERAQTNITIEVLNKIEVGMKTSLAELLLGNDDIITSVEYYTVLEPTNDALDSFTYGIMVCQSTATSSHVSTIIHDVSTIPGFVAELVIRMNSLQLSPIHVLDVLMDNLP